MEARLLQCTICGAFAAKPCNHCRSAAYCSPECAQTDGPTHKHLCSYFQHFHVDRLSASHYLGIWFPMTGRQQPPELCWLQAEEIDEGHFEPAQARVDQLLQVPGRNAASTQRHSTVRVVHGNILRGRPRLPDSLHILYLDQDDTDDGLLKANETLPQNLDADKKKKEKEGGVQWKGPLLVYLKAGTAFDDAAAMADVTLTNYRDALDYLTYYRPALCGSLTDHVGGLTARPDAPPCGNDEYIMTRLTRKVQGVRLNCAGDQHADPDDRRFVAVDVPRTHPLFAASSQDSDVLDVALTCLGEGWVACKYPNARGDDFPYPFNNNGNAHRFPNDDAGSSSRRRSFAEVREEAGKQRNRSAEMLMRRITGDMQDLPQAPAPEGSEEGGEVSDKSRRWAAIPKWRLPLATGSILLVKLDQTDLKVRTVRALCQLLEQRVMPLVAREHEVGKRSILNVLKDKEAFEQFL